MIKKCKQCQTEFIWCHTHRIYCSKECQKLSHKDNIYKSSKHCKQCGDDIHDKPFGQFCDSCAKNRKFELKKLSNRECLGCGKETKHVSRYCSECRTSKRINSYIPSIKLYIDGLKSIGPVDVLKIAHYYIQCTGKETRWNGLPVEVQIAKMLDHLKFLCKHYEKSIAKNNQFLQ